MHCIRSLNWSRRLKVDCKIFEFGRTLPIDMIASIKEFGKTTGMNHQAQLYLI